ncbi:bifunctional 4-hydroxy-2-oxoglutarate aldolase/2-dehydro-3-deoxy-phosphogluconate aldolase [Parasphingorhabdus sp.]|uniref:bifunctional 4-hydroxy-2-oxoglutarate aldolase/2-dehydro-3-deoxy-phosphogluconate aldolase n=1 Tax=Parasphingorhabdus sp. TaxID=2709688 RepID=UPI003263D916
MIDGIKPIEQIMRSTSVIPVLVINDVAQARSTAEALVQRGYPILEVTLRTECALEAIAEMKTVAGATVGAGTVTNPDQLHAALDAGAEFIVSPGLTEPLAKAAHAAKIPFLPGIANAGDIMRGLDLGLHHFKFFPAVASGGIAALQSLSAPFGQCFFCPTGGITEATAPDWLSLESVLCVGGSWIETPR